MSLTSELDDKTSTLRCWFDRTFPSFRAVQPEARWSGDLQLPATCLPNWRGRVGTAVDYRIRWMWPWVPAGGLIGTRVAPLLLGEATAASFVAFLDGEISELASAQVASSDTGERMARAALVLAQLETVGRAHLLPDPLATGLRKGASVEEMLASQDASAVGDVIALTESSASVLGDLATRPSVLNPTFAWSKRVGGADADFIVDGCLIELKTTSDKGLLGEVARQLIGYLLLDADDRYSINELGVLYARRPQFLRWPAADFLDRCAGRSVDVDELRAELDRLLPIDGRVGVEDPNQLGLFA